MKLIAAAAVGATLIALSAMTVSADAGERIVYGAYGGSKVVTSTIDETGASRSVERISPNGGTMTTTQDCAPGLSTCQRKMEATGAYGRTASGSATTTRIPGQSVTTGTVAGPNGGVYNRNVIRTW